MSMLMFTGPIIFYTPIVFVGLYLALNCFLKFKTPKHVCIVVLGDIGRSPRMIYHALSFAKEGFRVYMVGYKGSAPPKKLTEHENVQFFYVREVPCWIQYLPKTVQYFLKVIWQSIALGGTLLLMPKMGSYLLQNPPSIPTMLVTYVVARLRSSKLVIDWHNYGHTILALALPEKHPLVRFATSYEHVCGRLSDYNICVTQAMKQDLALNWNVEATTVYDRPPETFRSVTVAEKHDLLLRLAKEYPVFSDGNDAKRTALTTHKGASNEVADRDDRPALLVSSTSWTEDEDFRILLDALEAYDKCEDVPYLICAITGKGPQKDFYQSKIKEIQWQKVKFCLPWLAAEDYPLLLGSADVGVCLHKSSSGLDLPMKVVDMFGCGLPVCAVKFKCIGELVKHGSNGLVFDDSSQLLSQLKDLLGSFPGTKAKLDEYRCTLQGFQAVRWHQQWTQLVLPIFESLWAKKKPSKTFANSGIPDDFDEIGVESKKEDKKTQ